MRFESGMAGFLIVVLAVSGAIFGTIILNSSETTQEVTKYDFKTEVTGLFPVDTSPEFYDYDLSRNYTGYFTLDTQINGVNYFGGATFRETGVNNYPVRFAPESDTNLTQQLSGSLTTSDPPGSDDLFVVVWGQPTYTTPAGYQQANWSTDAKSVSLRTILSTYGLNDYDEITIKPTSTDVNSRVLFDSKDSFSHKSYGYGVDYVEKNYENTSVYNPNGLYSQPTVACLSCKIIVSTNTAYLYYGTAINNSELVKSISLDEAVIIYDSGSSDYRRLGDTVDILATSSPDVQYMDISQGVKVTGVTE